MGHIFINLDKWNSLPKAYQAVLAARPARYAAWMVAKYDSGNPPALKRMLARACS